LRFLTNLAVVVFGLRGCFWRNRLDFGFVPRPSFLELREVQRPSLLPGKVAVDLGEIGRRFSPTIDDVGDVDLIGARLNAHTL
jgi:hypothetical protein